MRISRGLKSFVALFGLAALMCGAAGSASAQDAAAAVAAAQKEAEAALAAPTGWAGPTSAPKPLPGKKIAVISCAQLTEGCNRPSRAAVEAAEKLGWEATIFDGKGDVGTQLAAINAAVDSKYDGIVLMIVDPVQINEGIQRAIDAKIPVVTLAEPAYTDERKALLTSVPDVSHDWLKTGELIGDYMIWKSNGELNALLLNDPEVTVVDYGQFAGTNGKLTDKNACPNCKVTVENFTIATLNTAPAALAASAVQRDPTINWVWCYDFCMANVATDLIARGLQGKIMGAGFDCNAQNLQLIGDDKVQVVCIADPRDWEAWASIDTLNRMMNGEPAVDQNIPVRLFDKSNLDQLTENDIKNGWQGGTDFRSEYLKIWGVQ